MVKKYLIYALFLVVGILIGYLFFSSRFQTNPRKVGTSPLSDPLNLFGEPNLKLDECLKMANPTDPLGLKGETPEQKAQREECISKYNK